MEKKEFGYIVDHYGDFHITKWHTVILDYNTHLGSLDEVKEIVDRLNGDFFKDE